MRFRMRQIEGAAEVARFVMQRTDRAEADATQPGAIQRIAPRLAIRLRDDRG
jgi:hypothetical protein